MDTELYIELQKVFDRVVKNRADPFPMYLTIQPLGEAAIQKAEKHGGNVLGMSKQNQACKLFTPLILEKENPRSELTKKCCRSCYGDHVARGQRRRQGS